MTEPSPALLQAIKDTAARVEVELDSLLTVEHAPEEQLLEAMRHGTLGGGKRLRPFLLTQVAGLFDVREDYALRAAAAVELVHCYSLIHDDLPAMDDDDLRRGRPTVHKQWDEATAILAGDALLTLAFEILADPATHHSGPIRCALIAALAKAAGAHGMVGGQMIDLQAAERELDMGETVRLQHLKTGCMIEVSCMSGAILGLAPERAREALRGYSHDLGLAFQIADDLLDAEGEETRTGKAVGKDADRGKATFVALMGLERARDQARMLAEQAVAHLGIFGAEADMLRDVAYFTVARRH